MRTALDETLITGVEHLIPLHRRIMDEEDFLAGDITIAYIDEHQELLMIQMDVLIVGSLAYDSLATPAGSVENELGGSASYGGFSAAFHNNKDFGSGVGIVESRRTDFNNEHLEWYKSAD